MNLRYILLASAALAAYLYWKKKQNAADIASVSTANADLSTSVVPTPSQVTPYTQPIALQSVSDQPAPYTQPIMLEPSFPTGGSGVLKPLSTTDVMFAGRE